IADVATGKSFQLTRGKKSIEGFEWSPDSRWLAFVTEREQSAIVPPDPGKKDVEKKDADKDDKKDTKPGEGKPAAHQLWLISPQGGEAWQLTRHETDIQSFHWSKDGKQIAFTASTIESKADKDRKEKYSDFEVFEEDFKQSQLWTVDVSAAETDFLPAKSHPITHDAKLNIDDFAWSPDSTLIAFGATPNPFLAFSGDQDIYVADLAHDNPAHKIVALAGPESNPVCSPDGKQLVFATALGAQYFYCSNGHIAVVDLDKVMAKTATTPAEVRDLTAQFD